MPTYVYECERCNGSFEVEQRITDEPLSDCSCGSQGSLRRVIQPTGIVFKGSGFHVTDYAPSLERKSRAAESRASSGEAPSSCGADGDSCACKTTDSE
jgi:putative FmdB family regulatory protein